MRRPCHIDTPQDRAEGDTVLRDGRRFAYDTQLVNSNGVNVHFWLGDADPTPDLLDRLATIARHNRDVVTMSYSSGAPLSYWAHQDMSGST